MTSCCCWIISLLPPVHLDSIQVWLNKKFSRILYDEGTNNNNNTNNDMWACLCLSQCDQIGLFLKSIVIKVCKTSSPITLQLFGLLWKCAPFMAKPAEANYWATFWKIWYTFIWTSGHTGLSWKCCIMLAWKLNTLWLSLDRQKMEKWTSK